MTAALSFAEEELAPRGEDNPQFLKELEKTMALLAFELPQMGALSGTAPTTSTSAAPPMPKQFAALLDPSHRLETAAELNAAILTAQSHGREPKLPQLMRLLTWAESLLEEKGAEWPKCECL